jgi:hypothetical protein
MTVIISLLLATKIITGSDDLDRKAIGTMWECVDRAFASIAWPVGALRTRERRKERRARLGKPPRVPALRIPTANSGSPELPSLRPCRDYRGQHPECGVGQAGILIEIDDVYKVSGVLWACCIVLVPEIKKKD